MEKTFSVLSTLILIALGVLSVYLTIKSMKKDDCNCHKAEGPQTIPNPPPCGMGMGGKMSMG